MEIIGMTLPIFRVVIMHSKRQVNGKLGHVVQILRLSFAVNEMLNLSNVKIQHFFISW